MSRCRTGWRSSEKARTAPQLVEVNSTRLAEAFVYVYVYVHVYTCIYMYMRLADVYIHMQKNTPPKEGCF